MVGTGTFLDGTILGDVFSRDVGATRIVGCYTGALSLFGVA